MLLNARILFKTAFSILLAIYYYVIISSGVCQVSFVIFLSMDFSIEIELKEKVQLMLAWLIVFVNDIALWSLG